MMAKSIGNKYSWLLRSVEEKALSKKMEEEKKKQQETLVPYLPKDCISNILIQLPLESLQRSRLVCKPWYNLINSRVFIDSRIRLSESVLIFKRFVEKEGSYPLPNKGNSFSVEANLHKTDSNSIFEHPVKKPASKYRIQFMEFKDGKSKIGEFNVSCLGNIRATCNGLILLENKLKKGGLLVMNPVTKKLMTLPLGTLYPPHLESFGFVLSNLGREYKIVHLFMDELGFVSCEILDLGTRFWRAVDGPCFGSFSWFGNRPVSAIGALHWMPHIDDSEYIVCMPVDNEEFHKLPLPKSGRTYDGIVEMGGFLGFVTHEEVNQIDIWCLQALHGDVWTKHHSITVGCILDMVPFLSLRISGEMIFRREEDGSLYAYNFRVQVMKKVEMEKGCIPVSGSFLPHVNSLVSWCNNN